MKRRFSTISVTTLVVTALLVLTLAAASPAIADGVMQISGIGYFATDGECTDAQGQGASYALRMTGDLQGCHYTFVESAVCSPSGTYVETGREVFVGTGGQDSFATTYRFEGKYQDCANLVGEFHGRCQHPIVEGSGTGIYQGVSGRIDMKDDIAAGNFPYRGHLQP